MRKLTKKQESEFRRAVKALRASGDPRNVIVAKNLRGGMKIVNYLFETQNKIEKLAPKGFEVEPIGLVAKTTKAKGEAVAFQWLLVSMMEKVLAQEVSKARIQNVETTSQTSR